MLIALTYLALFIALLLVFCGQRKTAIALFIISWLGAVILFINDLTMPLPIQL